MAWEAESNPSLIDHPKTYRDPVTIEHIDSQDAVNQQNGEGNFPHQHNNASDPIAEVPHSSQDYVNTPKIDTRLTTSAPVENDDISNARHDSYNQRDTVSTASTEATIKLIKMIVLSNKKVSHTAANTTYNLTLFHTSQTHTDISQLPNNQLIQQALRGPSSSISFIFVSLSLSGLYWITTKHFKIETASTRLQIQ